MIIAGLHVPLMPLSDVLGNAGAPEFWQSGPMGVNVGETGAVMFTLMVVLVPHCPGLGVNV